MPADQWVAVARAVIRIGDQLLVAQGRGDTFTHLPGGHVEASELPVEALLREGREELGRDASDVQPLADFDNIYDDAKTGQTIHEHNHIFSVKLFPYGQEFPPTSKEDHLILRWIALSDVDRERLMPPAVRPLISGAPRARAVA